MGSFKLSGFWALSLAGLTLYSANLAEARTALDPAVINGLRAEHARANPNHVAGPQLESRTTNILLNPTCKLIRSSISNVSAVFAPGTAEYAVDIRTSTACLSFGNIVRW